MKNALMNIARSTYANYIASLSTRENVITAMEKSNEYATSGFSVLSANLYDIHVAL